jgi:hypothetical protein
MRKFVEDIKKDGLELYIYTTPSMERIFLLLKRDLRKTIIIGFVSVWVGDIDNQFENVCFSAALNGYGPLLYDLAMQDSTFNRKKFLTPDPSMTSKYAKNVWDFYFNKRREELIIKPINDHIIGSVQESNCLNYGYQFKKEFNLDRIEIKEPSDIKVRKHLQLKINRFFSRMFYINQSE